MIVKIEDIDNAKDGVLSFDIEETPDGIKFHKPARAKVTVKRLGAGFISVTGRVEAQINATCDNCLKSFVYDISTEIDETYADNTLYEEYKEETEIKDNFFAIDLNGAGEIDLTDLIYQSLILAIPNKLVCDINCIGLEEINKYKPREIQDPRLEVFKTIKTEKDD